jgi:hypothetical protein
MKQGEYPFPNKGAREKPQKSDLRRVVQAEVHHGGTTAMPEAARRFANRFSSAVMRYPARPELQNWVRALIERKAPVEEVVKMLHDRVQRAPSEENQELALVLANEVARMRGGTEAIHEHITPELLARLAGKAGQP